MQGSTCQDGFWKVYRFAPRAVTFHGTLRRKKKKLKTLLVLPVVSERHMSKCKCVLECCRVVFFLLRCVLILVPPMQIVVPSSHRFRRLHESVRGRHQESPRLLWAHPRFHQRRIQAHCQREYKCTTCFLSKTFNQHVIRVRVTSLLNKRQLHFPSRFFFFNFKRNIHTVDYQGTTAAWDFDFVTSQHMRWIDFISDHFCRFSQITTMFFLFCFFCLCG